VVVSVNEQLAENPGALFDDPFGAGWIACICSTRLEEESAQLTSRRVVLVSTDATTAANHRERLAALGCRPVIADTEDAVVAAANDPQNNVFLFDADSLGGSGPELVRKVHATGKPVKAIVMASSDYRWETAYRDQGIFYYAVEPFADNEIVEVLRAVFLRPPRPPRAAEHVRRPTKSLHAVQVTNHNGHKVQLLAGPGLLSRHEGLGAAIMDQLIEQYLPVETNLSETEITPMVVLDAARMCDRVMVLMVKDMGRLPGTLVRDTKVEYVSAARENASRATTLVVEPNASGHGLSGLDERTIEALAGHITSEMMSY